MRTSMKRLGMLSIAIIASLSLFANSAFDHAYWVIKDGKFTNNISFKPYDGENETTKIPDKLVESSKDGVDAVEFRKLTKSYLDPRILFDENNLLNMSTNYILMMEYMIPKEHAGTKLIAGNKPLFIIGLAQTEDSLSIGNGAPACGSVVYIDAKWGKTNEWVSTYKYIFANPSVNTIHGLLFSYAREYLIGDMSVFPYIKNLCFIPTADNIKPFYAENFTFADDEIGHFYGESYNIFGPGKKQNDRITDKIFNGGIKPVVTENDINRKSYLRTFRNFIPDELGDSDGSGYIDCEILQALRIDADSIRDSIVIPGIQLPAGISKIYSEMLVKKFYAYDDVNVVDPLYPSVENKDMPIKYRFNTGEIIDVAKDTMKLLWTKYKGEVDVPAGATSVDLVFSPMACAYLVDEIILSSATFVDVKDVLAENNDFEIISYVDANGNIIVLNGELQAVYNMNGQIANINDKVVVILVKNEEGKMASKIVIR